MTDKDLDAIAFNMSIVPEVETLLGPDAKRWLVMAEARHRARKLFKKRMLEHAEEFLDAARGHKKVWDGLERRKADRRADAA
jgi:hypothetical protein